MIYSKGDLLKTKEHEISKNGMMRIWHVDSEEQLDIDVVQAYRMRDVKPRPVVYMGIKNKTLLCVLYESELYVMLCRDIVGTLLKYENV